MSKPASTTEADPPGPRGQSGVRGQSTVRGQSSVQGQSSVRGQWSLRIVALSGGVGGARLVHGLAAELAAEELTVIVNTGDDFEHWGLRICPDLDTVMYTLSGLAHMERGWGLAEETFQALGMVSRYGGPDWFQLGDRDLGTHLVRTQALRSGQSLSAVTRRLFGALGVRHRVLPMTDEPRPTVVDTREEGRLPFQTWLVRRRARPTVTRVTFEGDSDPAPDVLPAIQTADLVIIAPSNPYVSVEPILTLPGVRAAVKQRPVVAVSPIVGGAAVKGPLAEMMSSLDGLEPSARNAIGLYGDLVDAAVVEAGDEVAFADGPDTRSTLPLLPTRTVMGGAGDRARLAREVLDFGLGLTGWPEVAQ